MSGLGRGVLGVLGVSFGFFALGSLVVRLLGLSGVAVWVLWSILGVLGSVGAFFAYRLASSTAPPRPKEPDPVDVALDQARKKLRAQDEGRPGRLPVLLVVGPDGSAKTTTVLRTGVESELLAGEAVRGDQPIPTEALNVWFGEDTLFIEVAPSVMSDEDRWKRLVRRLRPDRLPAAIGRGEQAPRSVVVCYSCEEFLQPGASRAVPEAAKKLRLRLGELAQTLGVRLPVYVLFTKMDRLPYFTDYVRNFTDEEARQILGATMPVVSTDEPGDHVARETARLQEAMQGIFRSLARKRLGVLDREHDDEVRLGAYEFPREFLKVTESAKRFLVELCRPVQLGVSPFLRGFYFTGVRPVVVRDAAPTGSSPSAAATGPVGATSVFDPAQIRKQAARAPDPGGRRVPQWVFLARVFRDVALPDAVAKAVTAGGRRVEGLRRLLVGGAAAALLVLALGMTTSFFGNRTLAREAAQAVQAGAAPASLSAGGLASEEVARLERLRGLTDTLGRWDREGAPLGLRWGLWTGDDLHPVLRRVYFDRFRASLWRPTRSVLVSRLATLPDEPSPDAEFGGTYEDLKAYLVATEYPDRSTSDFLTPVLLSRWLQYPESGAIADSLARRHFDFFARELPYGNPYDDPADPQILNRARDYLGAFSGDDQLYQSLVGDASSELPGVAFAERYPGSANVLRSEVAIPGAFTAQGWDRVHEQLENLPALLAREEWVLGEGRSVPAEELDRLATSLRERYREEFVEQWTEYLSSASVARFAQARDAADKLALLSSNRSPLLQALCLASVNTDVDSAAVGPAFQPLRHTTPPSCTDAFVTDANQGYLQALGRLQASMERLAGSPDQGVEQASSAVLNDAAAAEQAVAGIARAFTIAGSAAPVGDAVQALLLGPVEDAQRVAVRVGPARVTGQLNSAAAAFCRQFEALGGRFPFSPDASADASPDDVDAIFRPGEGALWRFYEDALANVLEERGDRYEARSGTNVRVSPAFVRFFNQAADFSEAVYPQGDGPSVTFAFRLSTSDILPQATFRMDGRAHTFSQVQPASQAWVWDANTARSAAILGTVDGESVSLVESDRPGTWALFQLFQYADWNTVGPDQHQLTWGIPGRAFSVSGVLRGTSVFRRDFMSGLGCVPRVVG